MSKVKIEEQEPKIKEVKEVEPKIKEVKKAAEQVPLEELAKKDETKHEPNTWVESASTPSPQVPVSTPRREEPAPQPAPRPQPARTNEISLYEESLKREAARTYDPGTPSRSSELIPVNRPIRSNVPLFEDRSPGITSTQVRNDNDYKLGTKDNDNRGRVVRRRDE